MNEILKKTITVMQKEIDELKKYKRLWETLKDRAYRQGDFPIRYSKLVRIMETMEDG